MYRILPTLAIAAAAVGFGGQPAHAEAWTFLVPVTIQNLPPEVKALTIFCAVRTAGGIQIGGARVDQPVTLPSFVATATVLVARATGAAGEAARWDCAMIGMSANVAGYGRYYNVRFPTDTTAPPKFTIASPVDGVIPDIAAAPPPFPVLNVAGAPVGPTVTPPTHLIFAATGAPLTVGSPQTGQTGQKGKAKGKQ